VVGEYERAFCGSQYAAMAPLFEHYGVQLWMPEAGGRVDFASELRRRRVILSGVCDAPEAMSTHVTCVCPLVAAPLSSEPHPEPHVVTRAYPKWT
jgi:hypothetical protein